MDDEAGQRAEPRGVGSGVLGGVQAGVQPGQAAQRRGLGGEYETQAGGSKGERHGQERAGPGTGPERRLSPFQGGG